MKSIICALFFTLVAPSLADDEAKWNPYNQQFDKQVTLQGMGWGLGAKGLGIRVVTPDGIPIYFDSKDVEIGKGFDRWQGRLIEVTGILRKRTMRAAPKGAQGYGAAFEYLVVESAKIRGIEKVENSLTSKAEQADARQPSTRPESKGGGKPQPEAEGGSR